MHKILFLLLCFTGSSVWAACERSDIEFYLDKGFSPEQITSLCATPLSAAEPLAKPIAQPAPRPVAMQAPVQHAVQGQEQILADLAKALVVDNLMLENGQLVFQQRFKAKFGEEDVFGNLQEVKPVMQVSIALSSMRLIKAAKRIPIIRGAYVLLSGDVQQNLIDAEQYKPKQLVGINEFLAEEIGQNTVKIKVHSDADVNKVGADLQELGLLYRQR